MEDVNNDTLNSNLPTIFTSIFVINGEVDLEKRI